MDTWVGRTGIASRGSDVVVLHETGRSRQLDTRTDSVAIAFNTHGLDENPMIVVRGRVVEQFRWAANGGHDHVNLAVIIEIPERATSMCRANLDAGACLVSYIAESPLAQISKNGVRLSVMLLGIDIGVFTDMGIGAEQILVPIVVKVLNTGAPAAHLEAAKTDARGIGVSAEEAIALIAIERKRLSSEGGHEQTRPAVIHPVPKVHAHAGHRHAIFRVGDEGFDANLVESVARAIFEQEIPVVVVGDEYVHPSVTVVICDGHSHTLSNVRGNSHHFRDVGEGAIAVVVIQDIGFAFVKGRRTGEALAGSSADSRSCKRPVQIVAHEEVKFAVIIIVHPRRRHAPELLPRRGKPGNSGFGGDIGKGAVAVVVIKDVAVEPGNINVGSPVIVIVGRGSANAVALATNPGTVGNVGKCAVVVVMV